MEGPKFYDCKNLLELPEVKEILALHLDAAELSNRLRMFRRWVSKEHDFWIDACDEKILHADGSGFNRFLQQIKEGGKSC